jgi:hypothetical protein
MEKAKGVNLTKKSAKDSWTGFSSPLHQPPALTKEQEATHAGRMLLRPVMPYKTSPSAMMMWKWAFRAYLLKVEYQIMPPGDIWTHKLRVDSLMACCWIRYIRTIDPFCQKTSFVFWLLDYSRRGGCLSWNVSAILPERMLTVIAQDAICILQRMLLNGGPNPSHDGSRGSFCCVACFPLL